MKNSTSSGKRSLAILGLATSSVLAGLPTLVHATQLTFINGGTSLTTAGNWTGTTGVPTSSDNIVFNPTAATTYGINAGVLSDFNVQDITFNSGGSGIIENSSGAASTPGLLTLNGGRGGGFPLITVGTNQLTIRNGTTNTLGLVLGASGSFDVGSGGLIVNSQITETGGARTITKTSAGQLTLGNSNTFSGGLNINAGGLSLTNIVGAGTGAITYGTGAGTNTTTAADLVVTSLTGARTLANNIVLPTDTVASNRAFYMAGGVGNVFTLGGVISGGSALTTMYLNNSTSGDINAQYRLSNASNTFRASILLNRGGLQIDNNGALGDAANTVTFNSNSGAKLTFNNAMTYTHATALSTATTFALGANNVTASGVISGGAALTLTGTSSTMTWTGANTKTGAILISPGVVLSIGDGGASGALGGTAAVTNNESLVFNRTGTITVGNAIGGTGTLVKNGSGTVVLTNTNTYAGITTLNQGTLTIAGPSQISTNTINYTGASALNITGTANTFANLINLNSVVGNAAISTPANSTTTFSGAISGGVAGTTLFLQGGAQFTNTGTIVLNGSNSMAGAINIQRGPVVLGNANAAGSALIGMDSNANPAGSLQFGSSFSVANNVQIIGLQEPIGVAAGQSNTLSGIISESGGSRGFFKVGTGTLTLTGANTYTGPTRVSEGVLVVSGSGVIPNASTTVSPGAQLDISGMASTLTIPSGATLLAGRTATPAADIIGNVIVNGGTYSPGPSSAAGVRTLTQNGNLTLTDATIPFDLSSTATPGSDINDLITVNGDLNVSGGTTTFAANLINGGLQTGTYKLIGYTGTLTGDDSNFALSGLVSGTTRQAFGIDVGTPNEIDLIVSGNPLNLTWQGGLNSDAWDIASTFNFNTNAEQFFNYDSVLFNDTGTPNVNLSGTVTPGAVTVNATQNYTFNGGDITGTGTLTKSGTGTLTINSTNSYTGATTINGGTLSIATIANGGSVSPIGASTSAASNLVLNSGTLQFTGTAGVTDRGLTMGAGGGTIDVADTLVVGTIAGAGNLTKSGAGTLTLAGTSASTHGSTTISAGTLQLGNANAAGSLGTGPVTNNATLSLNRSDTYTVSNAIVGSGNVVKNAAGTAILSSSNSYTGGTQLNTGVLQINDPNALGTGTVTWNAYTRLNVNVPDGTSWTVANNFVLPPTGTAQSSGVNLLRTGDGSPTAGTTLRLTGVLSGGSAGQFYEIVDSGLASNHNNTVILDNPSNTFTGTIETWRGVLAITSEGALGDPSNPLILNCANFNGGLRFDAAGITLPATRSIGLTNAEAINTNTNNAKIVGVISGNTLGKLGLGTLTLTGGNTYIGTTISAGALQIGDGGTSGNLGSGLVTDNALLAFNRSDAISVGNTINGTGSLTHVGGGTTTLTGSNAYTGDTTVPNGTLILANSFAAGGSSVDTLSGATGSLVFDSSVATHAFTFGGLKGTNNLVLTDNGSNAVALTIGGNNKTTTFDGSIVGGTTLTKNGTGATTLTGTNSYTGLTTVNAGTLNIQNNQAAATGGWLIGPASATATTVNFMSGSNIVVGSGNNIQVGNTSAVGSTVQALTVAGTVTNAGSLLVGRDANVVLSSGAIWNQNGDASVRSYGGFTAALTLGPGSSMTYNGASAIDLSAASGTNATGSAALTLNGASLTTGKGIAMTAGAGGAVASLAMTGGSLVTLSADVSSLVGGTGNLQTGTGGFTVNTQNHLAGIATPIVDVTGQSGSLTKSGTGTLTLTGSTSSYTGPTTVNAGLLKIDGAYAPTVNSGTTLTVASAGNASIGGTASFYTVSSPSSDVTVNGQLNIASSSIADVSNVQKLTGTGSVTVDKGSLNAAAGPRVAGLSLTNGAVATVNTTDGDGAGPGVRGSIAGVSKVTSLSIDATSKLDLKNNGLIMPAAGNLNGSAITVDTLRAAIIAGRGGAGTGAATWSGAGGIGTSTFAFDETYDSIGYVWTGDPNLLVPPTDINGESYDAGDYVVKYCAGADADLNGLVDDTDVAVIGLTYDAGATTGHHWYEGDFNYDGLVNDDDVAIIGLAYNPANTPLSPSFYAALSAEYGASFASAFATGAGTVVPEPTSLGLLAVGAMGLLRRRRK